MGGAVASFIATIKLFRTPRSESLDADQIYNLDLKPERKRLADLELKSEQIRVDLEQFIFREGNRQRELQSLRSTLEQVQAWQEDFRQMQATQHRENTQRLDAIRLEIGRLRPS